jgi:hypothetical protein
MDRLQDDAKFQTGSVPLCLNSFHPSTERLLLKVPFPATDNDLLVAVPMPSLELVASQCRSADAIPRRPAADRDHWSERVCPAARRQAFPS